MKNKLSELQGHLSIISIIGIALMFFSCTLDLGDVAGVGGVHNNKVGQNTQGKHITSGSGNTSKTPVSGSGSTNTNSNSGSSNPANSNPGSVQSPGSSNPGSVQSPGSSNPGSSNPGSVQSPGSGNPGSGSAPINCVNYAVSDFFSSQNSGASGLQLLKCAYSMGIDLSQIRDSSRKSNLLHSAAAKGDLDSVKFLVETVKMDVNLPDYSDGYGGSQFSALVNAADNHHLDVVRYLVAHKADVNNPCIYTVLINKGYLDMIKYFIEEVKVSVNIMLDPNMRMSLLMRAVILHQFEIVKYLMSKGADSTIHTSYGSYENACTDVSDTSYLALLHNCQ